jgi:hypothetical protein
VKFRPEELRPVDAYATQPDDFLQERDGELLSLTVLLGQQGIDARIRHCF